MIVESDTKRRTIYKFLSNIEFENPLSVTLTEKKYFEGLNKRKIWIDKIRSSQNTKHFLNRINQKVFKNSFRRYGKCLKSFVVMEKSKYEEQPHIHLILEKPTRFHDHEFKNIINECWCKTNFGYHHTNIKQIYSNGWLDYLLKDRSKTDLLKDIDWENTYLGVSK